MTRRNSEPGDPAPTKRATARCSHCDGLHPITDGVFSAHFANNQAQRPCLGSYRKP